VTTDIKARLVVNLVRKCHFTVIGFEASEYEFANVETRKAHGESVSRAMVATSAGWYWSHAADAQTMFGFLADGIDRGKLRVVGLDDQLGGRDQPFSNDILPERIMAGLPVAERPACVSLLSDRTYGRIAESVDERQRLLDCLRKSRTGLSDAAWAKSDLGADYASTFAALTRFIARDAKDWGPKNVERDRSMADRLREVELACRGSCKMVVWTHNAHAARLASVMPDYQADGNLGSITAARYPGQVFALAFTAYSGEYRLSHNRPASPIPAAASGTLEALAIRGSGTADRYLRRRDLVRAGSISARMFNHDGDYVQDWNRVYDGVVNIYAEHVPVEGALN
jgi:erythromycin esterase-like protein